MDIPTLAQTIQIILAPVVMISACAITLGGMWGHLSSINDRLRAMNLERLDLWRASSTDAYTAERLKEIEVQTPILVSRHRQTLRAIDAMYIAILFYILCMFAIAAAELFKLPAIVALILFLAGTLLLLIAILETVLEIHSAQAAIEYEVKRVTALKR